MAKKPDATWKPTAEDYERILGEQNPWHQTGSVPDALAYKSERPLARLLAGRLLDDEPRRFQLVLGPRRIGKTTALYQAVRHLLSAGIPKSKIWWLRLDHPLLLPVPLDQWMQVILEEARATHEKPAYVFLDELAYANNWDLWLKTFYDEHRPIRIAGSSSSTAVLRDRRLESGVGRWDEQYLTPYLLSEYLALEGQQIALPEADTLDLKLQSCIAADVDWPAFADHRRRLLLIGGFPELLLLKSTDEKDEASLLLESQRTLRSDAVERAIYKDIPQAFTVDNPMLLERLLYTLAGQVTGVLSPTKLCQTLDNLSQPTFDRYLSYLEQAFLVFTLQNYSGNEATRQKRGRKLFFVDTAVRNAALQRGLGPLNDPMEMGHLQENQVASHLYALSQQSQIRLYHWRDGESEVDFIFDDPAGPLAFEISATASHRTEGLLHLFQKFPKFKGRSYLVGPSYRASHPEQWSGIGRLPLDMFLLAVSSQAEKAMQSRFGYPGIRSWKEEYGPSRPA